MHRNVNLLPLLLCLEHPNLFTAGRVDANETPTTHALSREHFSKILFTALDDDATLRHLHGSDYDYNGNHRQLLGHYEVNYEEEEASWQRMARHGWSWSRERHHLDATSGKGRKGRSLRSDSTRLGTNEESDTPPSSMSPFIVCSTTPNQSGYQRRQSIISELRVLTEHTQIVYNTDEESCFIVTASADVMESYHNHLLNQQHTEGHPTVEHQTRQHDSDDSRTEVDSIETDSSIDADKAEASPRSEITIGPLFDVLKLPRGSAMNILSDDHWSPPPIASVADLAAASARLVTNEFSYDNSTEEVNVDVRKWRRTLNVDLLPGAFDAEESAEELVEKIVEYVKDMAMVAPGIHGASLSSSSSYLRSNTDDTLAPKMDTSTFVSTREAFSLTATDAPTFPSQDENDDKLNKHLFRNPHNMWSNALKNGFEASHGCQVMLDTLEVRTRVEDENVAAQQKDDSDEDVESSSTTPSSSVAAGFEVILHPPSQFMKNAAVESSAWNKHCVLSLMIGLSIHPYVQTVEVGHQVELAFFNEQGEGGHVVRAKDLREMKRDEDAVVSNNQLDAHDTSNDYSWLVLDNGMASDEAEEEEFIAHSINTQHITSTEGVTNPQWIIQSARVNHRPFFDAGLDGTGEIVAVADGGLDVDNCYFRDSTSSASIYGANGWDLNHRKVVHYDDSFGDRTEKTQGHGTYVASILAGRRSADGRRESAGHADGTAPGSKLAFFDMANGYNGIADPGVTRLLKSLYNPDSSNQSISGARVINASWGRSYKGQYTSFCRQYDSSLQSIYPDLLLVISAGNTGRYGVGSIQDPADCKNPLAVGSTLSYGTDAAVREKGIEYLADYSSRGPTMDERMKVRFNFLTEYFFSKLVEDL